jgi:hypothetical protein
MNLITKFLPNLIPGLGAFANPWVLLGLMAVVSSAFFFGIYLEHGRVAAIEAQVEAQTKIYAAWSKQRNKEATRITNQKDKEHVANEKALWDFHRAVVNGLSNDKPNIVPGDAAATTSSAAVQGGAKGAVCLSADRLREEIDAVVRRLGIGLAGRATEGADYITRFQTCAAWAVEQDRAAKDNPQPE